MALQAESDCDKALAPPSDITAVLTGILGAILNLSPAEMADDGIVDADFSALGLNSVDYLEFVLNVERELNVDISDEVLLRQDLKSARTWIAYLQTHWHDMVTPDNRPAPRL